MNYQTFEPNQDLTAFIKCYWTLESPKEEPPEKQTIVPDGCMEMIFHYGDLYKQYLDNGNNIIQPRCFVIGQLTRPLEIEPTGETGIFSIRFHPEGFLLLTTNSIKEMENTAVSLEKLFGKDGQEIGQQILNANSTSERIMLVEKFLLDRLTDTETIDRIIKSTVETIITANGQLSVDELSKQTNLNRRQLLRKFSSAIGLSPKQLSRTIRLQTALKMLLNDQFTNLAQLAYENEYYDQAHFIKEFKEFTGSTPKEFYGPRLKMSSLFYGTD
ncbi:AraC family transcriptional regulator [Chryseobacterium indologenes]|uniref:helix-turn-helix transcriptional regulator n=1 Tax=Chryseobacterium TaxID=59732 RepID=UPI000BFCB544|nr:helix-turn-helix transcriptional regulator [Chryseobacterium indologenes]ATN04910.1 AraC family transcriptional regulator [Chryseobacterium indologenes]AYY86339.1 AraC family transcriptional regulator [Chryseobacterium indologenes]QIX83243.1 helix-turn-helix transcriptional regulator [Chryseobacterium indologenes]UDQ52928.1 helix-turn-helix transcriptional regulator [Chryseobacterium indologenes]HAO27997.1 AraC family transcriptional regulator [Chryseobacterium indologenes]